MTKMIQQNNVITSAIAHIEGKKEGSARYNSNMTDEQRDDITNLILLCQTHHVLVDQDPITYTVKYLKQNQIWTWKKYEGEGAIPYTWQCTGNSIKRFNNIKILVTRFLNVTV